MDDRLLKRFFEGQCNEQEVEQVIHWYLSGQADKALSDRIEAFWKESYAVDKDWAKASILKALNERLDADEETPPNVLHSGQRWWKWRYAAAVLLLMALSVGWWYAQYQATKETENVYTTHVIHNQTKRGEKRTLALDDGTLIKLNADSRIWYSEAFGKEGRREVFLEGEAYFEVASDTLRPFQILTGGVETTVLGTTFNINAYHPEESVTVSVVTGKVKVRQRQKPMPPVYLVPDEQAVYTVENSTLLKSSFDHQQTLAWKEGTLYFKNASFDEIVETLERWYGVDIEVRRQDIEDGFSGSYTKRSLKSVLNGIGFVLHFDYEIQGNKVTIK